MRIRTTCSRRLRALSQKSCCDVSLRNDVIVRVVKPAVKPGGLDGTAGVSVSRP